MIKSFLKNSDLTLPIASLTKLMTAIVAKENINKDFVKLSSTAIQAFGDFGDFKENEIFSKDDLIKGMLISSSNDASYALAEQLGVKNFVNLMNKKVKELKMNHTAFVDPAGLSYNNVSTAEDLLKLTIYIIKNYPEILAVTKEKEITIRELNSNTLKIIKNSNLLVKNSYFIGGKTGYFIKLNIGSFYQFSKPKTRRL